MEGIVTSEALKRLLSLPVFAADAHPYLQYLASEYVGDNEPRLAAYVGACDRWSRLIPRLITYDLFHSFVGAILRPKVLERDPKRLFSDLIAASEVRFVVGDLKLLKDAFYVLVAESNDETAYTLASDAFCLTYRGTLARATGAQDFLSIEYAWYSTHDITEAKCDASQLLLLGILSCVRECSFRLMEEHSSIARNVTSADFALSVHRLADTIDVWAGAVFLYLIQMGNDLLAMTLFANWRDGDTLLAVLEQPLQMKSDVATVCLYLYIRAGVGRTDDVYCGAMLTFVSVLAMRLRGLSSDYVPPDDFHVADVMLSWNEGVAPRTILFCYKGKQFDAGLGRCFPNWQTRRIRNMLKAPYASPACTFSSWEECKAAHDAREETQRREALDLAAEEARRKKEEREHRKATGAVVAPVTTAGAARAAPRRTKSARRMPKEVSLALAAEHRASLAQREAVRVGELEERLRLVRLGDAIARGV